MRERLSDGFSERALESYKRWYAVVGSRGDVKNGEIVKVVRCVCEDPVAEQPANR
jgi:hypothetical protein